MRPDEVQGRRYIGIRMKRVYGVAMTIVDESSCGTRSGGRDEDLKRVLSSDESNRVMIWWLLMLCGLKEPVSKILRREPVTGQESACITVASQQPTQTRHAPLQEELLGA
jgi:hypothetical protein